MYTDVPLEQPTLTEIDMDLDGQLASEGDCNDQDATVYTGAIDVPNDGIDQDCDGEDTTTDVASVAANVRVYPNPATTTLRVEGPAGVWTFLDARGQEVLAFRTMAFGTNDVDLNALSDGWYVLQLRSTDAQFSTPVHKITP